ncbi:hypothetical protein BST_2154 [Bacillus stercoris]
MCASDKLAFSIYHEYSLKKQFSFQLDQSIVSNAGLIFPKKQKKKPMKPLYYKVHGFY